MTSGVFERHEIKYLLDSRQRAALERAMEGRMEADRYGESTICSLYYDTPDSRLIRRSLEKPDYKEKLRLRSYGRAEENSVIFVELKKKVNGVVYKRRIPMLQDQAVRWTRGDCPLPENLPVQNRQIAREIDYTLRYYGSLRPAMYLAYDRIAYFCPEDPELRVTLDRNIRWRTEDLSLTAPTEGEQLLRRDLSLLEIKTATALPLWLIRTLEDNGIQKCSFSKYGTAYTLTQSRDRGLLAASA